MNRVETKPAAGRRRRFLIGSLAVLGLGAAGVGVLYQRARDTDVVVAVLQRRLAGLKGLGKAEFQAFAEAYVKHRREHQGALRALGTVAGLARHASPYDLLPMGHRLRRLEDNVVSNFMLATDHFEHEDAPDRPTRYIGWHDPYVAPCRRIFGVGSPA
jgi:hypothetical protein